MHLQVEKRLSAFASTFSSLGNDKGAEGPSENARRSRGKAGFQNLPNQDVNEDHVH